jgi:hypothetical protein
MARVVVTDDSGDRILMDEWVQRVHLADRYSSMQVIERLAWAVADADHGHEDGLVPSAQRGRPLQAA